MDLNALISNFKEKQGTMPQVNPLAAAKVLEAQTKPEVAGQPEPATAASAAVPVASATATGTPASTAGSSAPAEPAVEGKARRTAAVVQAELDQAQAELAQTKAALKTAESRELDAQNQLVTARLVIDETKAELAKAVEFAQSVVADNARLAEVEPAAVGTPATVESASDFLKTRGFGIFTLGGS
jgi:hypothetical protein